MNYCFNKNRDKKLCTFPTPALNTTIQMCINWLSLLCKQSQAMFVCFCVIYNLLIMDISCFAINTEPAYLLKKVKAKRFHLIWDIPHNKTNEVTCDLDIKRLCMFDCLIKAEKITKPPLLKWFWYYEKKLSFRNLKSKILSVCMWR